MGENCIGMGAAEYVDLFHGVHGQPFEGVVQHWDVDEGKEDFWVLSGDGAETLDEKIYEMI